MLKIIQKIAHFFEQYFSKLKSVLEPRQFLYVSSILVGLSAALAVIVLKTFAHNVFLFSQYLNKEFQLWVKYYYCKANEENHLNIAKIDIHCEQML